MRRLVLLRHGETDHNASGRAQGHLDVPLNARGLAQAEAVAPVLAQLDPAFVVSSDLQRARTTAEVVAAACGLEVRTDARFREFHVGANRENRTWQEYADLFPDEAAVLLGERDGVVPGRESQADVRARWQPALTEAAAAVPEGGCGLVVAHGASLRTGILAFLGLPPEAFAAFGSLGNCAWVVLEEQLPTFREHGTELRWRLTAWNRQLHPL